VVDDSRRYTARGELVKRNASGETLAAPGSIRTADLSLRRRRRNTAGEERDPA